MLLQEGLGADGQEAGADPLQLQGHEVRLVGHQPDAQVNRDIDDQEPWP